MRRISLVMSALFALAAIFVPACGGELSRTQVTAVVQAESGVDATATRLEVVVMGGAAGEALAIVETLGYGEGESNPLSFPVRVAIVPQNGNASRVFEIVATAFDTDGPVASARVAGGFEAESTQTLDVWLRDGVVDGGMDAAADAAVDASTDGAVDATRDAPADAPTDGTIDATAPDAGPSPLLELYNGVFVTSTAYEGGSLGGLGGADTICQTHAMDAGLPRPTSYVALLSTSSVNARDRLGTSRGWVRVDGLPFADQIADIAAGAIYYPILLSETGVPPVERRVMTATSANLTKASPHCGNWSDTSLNVGVRGDSRDGTGRWVDLNQMAAARCSAPLGIYCFGTGVIRELVPDPAPAGAARAFASNAERNGRMGIGVFDTLCANAATDAGLVGTFRALVTPNGSTSAVSRFTFTGPWYRPDGVLVAHTLADVASESLEASISVTADGFSYGNFRVWAGAESPAATSGSAHCAGWTAGIAGTGKSGWAGSTYDFFTGQGGLCNVAHRVLCLEDRP